VGMWWGPHIVTNFQNQEIGTPIICTRNSRKFGATMPTFGKPHPILPLNILLSRQKRS
jgi:hypothetical protein